MHLIFVVRVISHDARRVQKCVIMYREKDYMEIYLCLKIQKISTFQKSKIFGCLGIAKTFFLLGNFKRTLYMVQMFKKCVTLYNLGSKKAWFLAWHGIAKKFICQATFKRNERCRQQMHWGELWPRP